MQKDFDTENYGTVTVKSVMVDVNSPNPDSLIDGIEIKGDDIELITIPIYYDIDDLATDEVDDLISHFC